VVEYRSKRYRVRGYLIGVLVVAFALLALAIVHATRLRCTRASGDGVCVVWSLGIFVPDRERSVPLGEVTGVEHRLVRSSKGGTYAEAWLATRTLGQVSLAGRGFMSAFAPDDPVAAASALRAFLDDPSRPDVTVWLTSPLLSSVAGALFGVGLLALAFAMIREQVRPLMPIRAVVDHDAEVVRVARARAVALGAIEGVRVEAGRALYWASGKHEHVPGWRVALVLRGGEEVPLTPDFRAGPLEDHEAARAKLAAALGLPAKVEP
jgi:hypothetical protein